MVVIKNSTEDLARPQQTYRPLLLLFRDFEDVAIVKTVRMLPVTTGIFAAGDVQISGPGIYEGLQVTDSQG